MVGTAARCPVLITRLRSERMARVLELWRSGNSMSHKAQIGNIYKSLRAFAFRRIQWVTRLGWERYARTLELLRSEKFNESQDLDRKHMQELSSTRVQKNTGERWALLVTHIDRSIRIESSVRPAVQSAFFNLDHAACRCIGLNNVFSRHLEAYWNIRRIWFSF